MDTKEELKYCYQFLEQINKKLEDKTFMQRAPINLIEEERKKKADTEAYIEKLKQNQE